MWRCTKVDAEGLCYAGLWDPAETAEEPVESFTIMVSVPDLDRAADQLGLLLVPEQDEWAGGSTSEPIRRPF